jgi:hypothetical protein
VLLLPDRSATALHNAFGLNAQAASCRSSITASSAYRRFSTDLVYSPWGTPRMSPAWASARNVLRGHPFATDDGLVMKTADAASSQAVVGCVPLAAALAAVMATFAKRVSPSCLLFLRIFVVCWHASGSNARPSAALTDVDTVLRS